MSHDPLRCVVCDTRFVTDPRRERPLIPAVTYPDVCGIACKLNALEPPRVLSNGGSWALYELYAALVTGPRYQPGTKHSKIEILHPSEFYHRACRSSSLFSAQVHEEMNGT